MKEQPRKNLFQEFNDFTRAWQAKDFNNGDRKEIFPLEFNSRRFKWEETT